MKEFPSGESFSCLECKLSKKTNKCEICKDKRTVDNQSNFIKFLNFVLEFKIGKIKPQLKKKKITIINS